MIITVNKISVNNRFVGDLSGIDTSVYILGEVLFNEDNDNYEVEVTKRPEIIEKENEAIRASSQLVIAERLLDQRLPIERIYEFKAIFDRPVQGRVYKLDWVLIDPTSGELFKVAQPQITYERTWDDFSKFPALFAPFRQSDVIQPWVQPQGAHDAYDVGIKVTHKGFTWESTIPANTTEPEETVFNWWKKIS